MDHQYTNYRHRDDTSANFRFVGVAGQEPSWAADIQPGDCGAQERAHSTQQIEAMTEAAVFEAVKSGQMTYAEFETWHSEQRNRAYSDGQAAESYSNAMSYMGSGD